jgi:hypothetical protein
LTVNRLGAASTYLVDHNHIYGVRDPQATTRSFTTGYFFTLLEPNDLPNDYWLITRFGTAAFFTIKTGDSKE